MKVNKLDKAHDFVMNCIKNSTVKLNDENLQNIISNAWKYADLMQEEYDKRNNARLENNKKLLEDAENKVWQPDWGVAPDNMLYFAVDKNGDGYFYEYKPYIATGYNYWGDVDGKYEGLCAKEYDQHNYQGDWRQSLRERPKDNKVESGYVQQIPRPFLVNGCDVGNLDLLKEGLRSGLNDTSKEIPAKVEVKSKQHSCNCPHWKGSSFFMGDTFTCNDCGGVVMI